MSATAADLIEQRMRSLDRGVRLFGMTFLLLSGTGNVAMAYSLKRFAANLRDDVLAAASPFVQTVLGHPDYGLGLALLFPVVGSVITLRARDPWQAMSALSIYLFLVTAQFVGTTWVLGAPIAEMLGRFGSLMSRL